MTEQALPGFDVDLGVEWEPTRAFALERLDRFLPSAGGAYASRRNFDLGPKDRSNVSALSPLIRHRLILEEEVLRKALERHRPDEAEKFVQEVIWRAYFKGWLEHRPIVWRRYCEERDRLIQTLESDSGLETRYAAAVSGRTGLPYFDHWTETLLKSGYLHNHSRMWYASIWIYTLELPWELGADFFLRQLLDGDPASNTLSWRWVGGLHTPGKTYLARADNIERFTRGRFRPGDELAREAPPLWEPPLGAVEPLRAAETAPMDRPFALLLTEEDCHLESLALPHRPELVIASPGPEARSPLPLSEPAQSFAQGALRDALNRAQQHFELPPDQALERPKQEWATALAERNLDTLVMAETPVGPTRDALRDLETQFSAQGIRLVSLRREYDSTIWPHAQKGFFNLRRRIPRLLSQLDLT
ncbi:MAG: FAD-binding domain-containing protein [Myxococcota bacterium]